MGGIAITFSDGDIQQATGVYSLVGSHHVTPADHSDAETLLDLRRGLLSVASVQARLDVLVEVRADAKALRTGAELLSHDLDGQLTPREIEHAVCQVRDGKPPSPSLVGHTGSGRLRVHKHQDETVRIVVESLGRRAEGVPMTIGPLRGHDEDRQLGSDALFRLRLRKVAARLLPE